MPMPHVVNMPQSREVTVHSVKQPETSDVRRRKIRQSCAALPPAPSQNTALRREYLDQPPRDAHQIIVRRNIQQRRNVLRVQPESPCRSALHASDLQRIATLARLALNQKPQILPRDLHRLLRKPGILVDRKSTRLNSSH